MYFDGMLIVKDPLRIIANSPAPLSSIQQLFSLEMVENSENVYKCIKERY